MTDDNGKQDSVTCAICGHTQHYSDFEEIVGTGWIPSYWEENDECEGPVCPTCVQNRLKVGDDGEYEPNQSFLAELDKLRQRKAEENVVAIMRRWHGMR